MDQYKNFINESKDVKDALHSLDSAIFADIKDSYYKFEEGKISLEQTAKVKSLNPIIRREIDKALKGQPNHLGKYL
jgi:hypothetical protein